MSEATAIAHPNIALIKYWGKRDIPMNLPAVPSLSLTLGTYRTRTRVVWGSATDEVVVNGAPAKPGFAARALAFLDRIDANRPSVRIETDNNFPAKAGLASSSSGFAALALAATEASGHQRPLEALSALARQGSGSACRSLWGGFVEWKMGQASDGSDSHGVPLHGPDWWDVRMVMGVVSDAEKKVGSTAGMQTTERTCPYWQQWVDTAAEDVRVARDAIAKRNLDALGEVMEQSTFKMHATMHTTRPPLLYWQPGSVACLHAVFGLREQGISAWATMDAGPQVKVLCMAKDAEAVARALAPHTVRTDILAPGPGAYLCK